MNNLDWSLFITFCCLQVFNVILQTAKSIITIKCRPLAAAAANAAAYGLYAVVLVYMVCDLPLILKVIVAAATNFVGVLIVKQIETKARKDKLWKLEATVRQATAEELKTILHTNRIPYSTTEVVGADDKKYILFFIFCKSKAESSEAIRCLRKVDAKFFIGEDAG